MCIRDRPQSVLDVRFDSRQDALDGFLGAAYALHLVAMVSVMAEGRDLQKAVGSGDGAWFVTADHGGRGQVRSGETGEGITDPTRGFTPTLFLYDNYPGGVGPVSYTHLDVYKRQASHAWPSSQALRP